jgi:hypothetical protein
MSDRKKRLPHIFIYHYAYSANAEAGLEDASWCAPTRLFGRSTALVKRIESFSAKASHPIFESMCKLFVSKLLKSKLDVLLNDV